jgi:hypothetical protein
MEIDDTEYLFHKSSHVATGAAAVETMKCVCNMACALVLAWIWIAVVCFCKFFKSKLEIYYIIGIYHYLFHRNCLCSHWCNCSRNCQVYHSMCHYYDRDMNNTVVSANFRGTVATVAIYGMLSIWAGFVCTCFTEIASVANCATAIKVVHYIMTGTIVLTGIWIALGCLYKLSSLHNQKQWGCILKEAMFCTC